MVMTPGDILERCRALDARIVEATKIVQTAPAFDAQFREAWQARQRRWEAVRAQCGDYASRMWGFKWGPTLDDWERNQAEWEARIQKATGILIPIGQPIGRPSDETITTTIQQAARFPEIRKTMGNTMLLAAGGAGLALIVYAWQKGKR